jgi:valyl-tRNA synthetase
MDPLDLIDEYGTDAVRFTLTAMAAMGRDLKLSNSRIAGYRNFGTKMWNAARFAEMNDCRPVSEFDPTTVKETLNQWIVGETARFKVTFDKALSSYRFNDAASIAYTHVWGKFCDWYVEFSKPLLNLEGSAVRKETQETMAWALDQCLIVLHPLMPFITEELWGAIEDRDKMLIVSDWPEYTEQGLVNTSADNEMEWIISLIEQIRSVKSELGVPAGAKIPLVIIKLDEKFKKVIEKNRILIERLARLSSISSSEQHLRGIVTLTLEGGEFALPISDLIDLPSEKARLFKTIEKTEKEVTMLTAKLANEKFIIKAPETVINEVKIRLEELIKEQKKLSGALYRLKAVES